MEIVVPKYLVYFKGRYGQGTALAEASDEQGALDAVYAELDSDLKPNIEEDDSPYAPTLNKVTIVDIDQSGFLGTDTAVIVDEGWP